MCKNKNKNSDDFAIVIARPFDTQIQNLSLSHWDILDAHNQQQQQQQQQQWL